jgi:hypothetical protein
MGQPRYDLMCPVPFASVSGTTKGVIRKAALTSSAATEAGLGVGGSVGNAANYAFSASGVYKIGGGNGEYVTFPLAAGSERSLAHRGGIQFDVDKETFLANISTFADGAALNLMDFYDGATAVAFAVAAFNSQGSTAGNYRQFTDGHAGEAVFARAAAIRSASAFIAHPLAWSATFNYVPGDYVNVSNAVYFCIAANLNQTPPNGIYWVLVSSGMENPQVCLHDETSTSSAGKITINIGWDVQFVYWYINGHLVAQARRKQMAITPTMIRLFPDLWVTAKCPIISNVLLLSSPPPHPDHRGDAYHVQFMMHSFGNKGSAQSTHAPDLALAQSGYPQWAGDIGGYLAASEDSVISAVRKNVNYPIAIINTSKSGQNLSWIRGQVLGTADVLKRCSRNRLSFMVLCGHMNEGTDGAAQANTSAGYVHDMNVEIIGRGIIPIWIMENNGLIAAAAYSHPLIVAAIQAQLVADKASIGDFGVVDFYTASGGLNTDSTLMEHTSSPTSAVHNNWKGSRLMGQMIAAEINRLIVSPPAYALLR